MDSSIFFGGSVVAAFVAGMIALFAPCCLSVMLPAYFASSFQNRSRLVAMSFVFAAGVGTIILPLVMGAIALRQLFVTQHTAVYVLGGSAMLGMALFTFLGGKLQLPMPGRRSTANGGPLSVYTLGVFSGVAGSCCAPVLAGVLALSSVARSVGLAAGLGGAYIFGMVAPLFVISLLWERFDWRTSALFHQRMVTWCLGSLTRTLPLSMLLSALLLGVMGILTIWVGFSTDSMSISTYWSQAIAVQLQHVGGEITQALSTVPNWLAALVLFLLVAALGLRARAQWRTTGHLDDATDLNERRPDSRRVK